MVFGSWLEEGVSFGTSRSNEPGSYTVASALIAHNGNTLSKSYWERYFAPSDIIDTNGCLGGGSRYFRRLVGGTCTPGLRVGNVGRGGASRSTFVRGSDR